MKKGSKNSSIPAPEVKKGAWTKEEDDRLTKCIEKCGKVIKWHELPRKTGLNRCRKSCRLRWLNYLRPNIKRGDFDDDEVDLMLRLHKLLGNRWTLIAGRLPGRTPNDVKNYWNTHLHKKLLAAEKQEVAAPPPEEQVEATEMVLEEPKFPKIREAKPQPDQRFPNKTMENENIILNKKSTTSPLLTSIESANMSSLGPGPEENSAGLWPLNDGDDEFFPKLSDLSQLNHLDYWEVLNLDQLPLMIDYSNDIYSDFEW